MDFDYITVPAIIVLALVLVACGALRRIITLQRADQSRVRRWKEGIILWPVGLSCFAMAALGAVNGVSYARYASNQTRHLGSVRTPRIASMTVIISVS
jgi:hypothetical protein